jgi:hypothetical protein
MLSRVSNAALAAGACLIGLGLGGAYQATQQPASTIPSAVRAACDKYFGAGGGAMPEEKTWDGAKVYVVSGTKEGAPAWLTLSPNGDVQEMSKGIQFKDLPKSLQDKLTAKYPKAKGFEEILSVQLNLFSINVVKEDGKYEQVNLFAAGNKWEPNQFKHEWKKEQKSEGKKNEPKKDAPKSEKKP